MLWNAKKPNEKLQSYVIIFLWDVIYVHFYNWDRPPDLVLIVYDLIELIIEVSLWTKDYFTFDTYTQHTSLMFNEYLFYLCDCTCSNVMYVCSAIYGSNEKDFCSFCLLLKVICITHVFQILLVWKTCFLDVFVTYFMCKFSNELKGPILKFFSFGQRVSRLFCNCFVSKAYQRNTSKIFAGS